VGEKICIQPFEGKIQLLRARGCRGGNIKMDVKNRNGKVRTGFIGRRIE
jgi:shikimate 5-dehydrogenase